MAQFWAESVHCHKDRVCLGWGKGGRRTQNYKCVFFIHVHSYIYIYMYVCMYVCMYVSMYVRMYESSFSYSEVPEEKDKTNHEISA